MAIPLLAMAIATPTTTMLIREWTIARLPNDTTMVVRVPLVLNTRVLTTNGSMAIVVVVAVLAVLSIVVVVVVAVDKSLIRYFL